MLLLGCKLCRYQLLELLLWVAGRAVGFHTPCC
jgi:hypothetical protein